jgi:hypothetical protein
MCWEMDAPELMTEIYLASQNLLQPLLCGSVERIKAYCFIVSALTASVKPVPDDAQAKIGGSVLPG